MTKEILELIIFDLDGTLTESKSPMDTEMSMLIGELLKVYKVAVISGGSLSNFESQFLKILRVPKEVLKNLFLFPTCGARFYRYEESWRHVYSHEFSPREKKDIFCAFDEALPAAGYKLPDEIFGDILEDRGTQITFSGLGQRAPVELKTKWDPDMRKRLKIKSELDRHIPHFEVRIGGTTSVDVTKKGVDKAYGIKQMELHLKVPKERMIFFGDAIFPGGNDYPVFEIGVESVRVKDPHETKRHIQKFISEIL